VIQVITYIYFGRHLDQLGDQTQYRVIWAWIGYVLVGMWLAGQKKFLKPGWSLVLAMGGLLGSVIVAQKVLANTGNIIAATRTTKVSVLGYSLGMVGLLMAQGWRWVRQSKVLSWLGKWSYLIYLAHTTPLSIIKLHLPGASLLLVGLSYVGVLGASIMLVEMDWSHKLAKIGLMGGFNV
jgi:peptidoglycan/LPS O-acetylase OafA/YrhL